MVSRLFATLALLLSFSNSFSQWTRVQQLPPTFISTFYHRDSTLYAGGKNIIYISRDNGQTWDSTSTIPELSLITSIIVYNDELYAAASRHHVYKSPDGGNTWQIIFSGNDTLDVSDFCVFRGELFASTFSNSVYKLDPITRNHWLSFNNGLGNLSIVSSALASTRNTMIAGTLNNGLYDYLPPNSNTWEERFLLPHVSVNEGAFHIITAHDTLFFPGRTGFFYTSADGGLNWNLFGNRLTTGNTSLVNAKEALLASRYFSDGVNSITSFYYLKKDSLQHPFVNFSSVVNHFTWKIDIVGNKLWDASDHGLFYLRLTDLPGITAADDSLPPVILPVRVTLFQVKCLNDHSLITWQTAQDQHSSRFKIEKSNQGNSWEIIGELPAKKNNNGETIYSFTDLNSSQNSYYRIAAFDFGGHVQYTNILRSSCSTKDQFKIFPNPVHNTVFISLEVAAPSQATIKIFDQKGALVSLERTAVSKGSNQLSIDISLLATGIYSLSINANNGQIKRVVQIIKN
jgi:hypothetical protein